MAKTTVSNQLESAQAQRQARHTMLPGAACERDFVLYRCCLHRSLSLSLHHLFSPRTRTFMLHNSCEATLLQARSGGLQHMTQQSLVTYQHFGRHNMQRQPDLQLTCPMSTHAFPGCRRRAADTPHSTSPSSYNAAPAPGQHALLYRRNCLTQPLVDVSRPKQDDSFLYALCRPSALAEGWGDPTCRSL